MEDEGIQWEVSSSLESESSQDEISEDKLSKKEETGSSSKSRSWTLEEDEDQSQSAGMLGDCHKEETLPWRISHCEFYIQGENGTYLNSNCRFMDIPEKEDAIEKAALIKNGE